MDILKSKQDLETFRKSQLLTMAKYYELPIVDSDDLCWLLAMEILRLRKGQMEPDFTAPRKPRSAIGGSALLRGLAGKPVGARVAGASVHAKAFNLKENECRWPTRLVANDRTIKDCNIPMEKFDEIEYKDKKYDLVKIPAGSKLYHGTKAINFIPQSPNEFNGTMLWFATTDEHTMPLGPIKILTFTVKTDLLLVYEKNMLARLRFNSGKEFEPIVRGIAAHLSTMDVKLDGYVGCNECEVGLFKHSLGKLDYPPSSKDVPYIE